MFVTIWSVLSSSLLFWEIAGYVCTVAVICGCAGEYIAEFTCVPKSDDGKHKISRLSLIILTVGIAGELLTAIRSSQISGEVIANLQTSVRTAKQSAKDAADAAERAKKAADAAKTKADAVGVEADQAQSKLDEVSKKAEDMNAELAMAQWSFGARHILNKAMLEDDLAKEFKGKHIIFKSYVQDEEAFLLCRQLESAARKPEVGVIAEDECADEPLRPNLSVTDLQITAPTIDEAQKLGMILKRSGVSGWVVNLGVSPEVTVLVGRQASIPLFWPKATNGNSKSNTSTKR